MSQNFFDHAYKELSHGAVLAYSLFAFREGTGAERTSAAIFGQSLVHACFPNHIPVAPDEITVKRESTIGATSHQPDFILELTRNGESYASVIETKYNAPSSVAQLKRYADALSDVNSSKFERAVLYKSTLSYTIPRGSDFLFLGPHEIEGLLRDARESGTASWIVDEYYRWLRQIARRDELFAEPEFHDWFLSGESLLPTTLEAYADVWRETSSRDSSHVRRRVYWHIVRQAAKHLSSLSDLEIDRYVNSEGNANSDSAWVQLKVAEMDAPGGGSIFYRLDQRTYGLGFELRLYAGPKRGSKRSTDKERWATIKRDLLHNIQRELKAADLHENVDLPGYQRYSFQKRSRETSIACIWLKHHREDPPRRDELLPSQLYEIFPRVHECTRNAVSATKALQPNVQWLESVETST